MGGAGRKKGHWRKLDSLQAREVHSIPSVRPSVRPSFAPEGREEGKEQGGQDEDISWFDPPWSYREGEESVSLARGRHYVRVVNNSRLDFFQHVYFLPAAVANEEEEEEEERRWSGDPRPPVRRGIGGHGNPRGKG